MWVVAGCLAAAGACGDRDGGAGDAAAQHALAHALELAPVPAPPVEELAASGEFAPSRPVAVTPRQPAPGRQVAVIGEYGHLGSLTAASVDDVWPKWQARPSLDRSTAVMTLRDEIARTLDETRLAWVSLPDAVETGGLTIDAAGELNAVSGDGGLVALTNFASLPQPGEIAGAKLSTTLWIADRTGVRYEAELDGNFVAEAFGRATGPGGLPAHVFLLEHIPADAPRFYRVRVLSTETGEVSLPLNIRDKSQLVDERMSGLSRSQVIADEHGLLFTLYRGTIDGNPDGQPYAFVHTLDLANGVWCLFLDPALELDTLPGSIAVGRDRLFVASANGKIGSIPIRSITNIERNPEMDWVVDAGPPGDLPPVLLADAAGVWVGLHGGTERLVRVDNDGQLGKPITTPGADPTALAFDGDGQVVAAGNGWSTLGESTLPAWFGTPTELFAG